MATPRTVKAENLVSGAEQLFNYAHEIAHGQPAVFTKDKKPKKNSQEEKHSFFDRSVLIVDNNADINVYPTLDAAHPADPKNQLTIGDLHGNALKLIYVLIKQNVLKMKSEAYAQLLEIYNKKLTDVTLIDLKKFKTILEQAEVQAVGTVRLIGDELAGRGRNDYFTLQIIDFLQRNGISIEILISNHGYEFINVYEKSYKIDGLFCSKRLQYEQAASMYAVHQFLTDKWIDKENELDPLIKKAYQPQLRALSYTLSEDNQSITIYSHAVIDLKVVQALVNKLNNLKSENEPKIEYQDDTAINLAKTIDSINIAFQCRVKTNRVHELYDERALLEHYQHRIGTSVDGMPDFNYFPFEFLIWNEDSNLDRPERHSQYGYHIDFVHGSFYKAPELANDFNLVDLLGQPSRTNRFNQNHPKYCSLFSQQQPAPRVELLAENEMRLHMDSNRQQQLREQVLLPDHNELQELEQNNQQQPQMQLMESAVFSGEYELQELEQKKQQQLYMQLGKQQQLLKPALFSVQFEQKDQQQLYMQLSEQQQLQGRVVLPFENELQELQQTEQQRYSSLRPKFSINQSSLNNLFTQIKNLRTFVLTQDSILNETDIGTFYTLAGKLLDSAQKAKDINSENDLATFKIEFEHQLHSRDELLGKYFSVLKPLIANILIALTGLGLIVIAARLAYTKYTLGKCSFFFDRTPEQQKIDCIGVALKNLHATK